jgi:hypothetical protein
VSAAGTWQITIATPFGKQEVEYLFATANDVLTGHATQGSDTTALIDLVLEGSRLTWTQHVTRPMKLKLQFDVTLEADTLNGTAKAGALPASKVQGVRVRSDQPATSPA